MDDVKNAKPFSKITLPIGRMMAALLCASTEQTRYYLNGVFLHRKGDRVRIVSTDGHKLYVASHQPLDEKDEPIEAKDFPEWLEKGVIISSEMLKEKLALIKKTVPKSSPDGFKTISVSYGTDQPKAIIEDFGGNITFQHHLVDGQFPDYERILGFSLGVDGPIGKDDKITVAEPKLRDFQPVSYNGKYLKKLADVGGLVSGTQTMSVFGKSPSDPTIVTFPGAAGVMCVLMPVKTEEALAGETAAMLQPAVKSTIGALKAHVTRNLKWAKEAKDAAQKAKFEARADEYNARIKAILKDTKPQIEGPKDEKAPEAPKAAPAAKPATNGATPPKLSVVNGVDPNAPAIKGAQSDKVKAPAKAKSKAKSTKKVHQKAA